MAILHYFQQADFEVSCIFITGILEKSFLLPFFLTYLKFWFDFFKHSGLKNMNLEGTGRRRKIKSQCEFVFLSHVALTTNFKGKISIDIVCT